MRSIIILVFLVFVTLASKVTGEELLKETKREVTPMEKHFKILMPEAQPMQRDDYLCSAFGIKDLIIKGTENSKVYITGFNVNANSSRVGHVAIVRCNKAYIKEGEVYDCLNRDDKCGPSSRHTAIIYDWGKDAGPISLPADVGFEVDVDKDQIVMQVHYKVPLNFKDKTSADIKYTETKPQYNAGMIILQKGQFSIPPGVKNVYADINCKVQDDITMFAFMTHAHGLGADISGYIVHQGNHTEFARGDPQKPQTFHQMEHFQVVTRGDMLRARCTFDGTRASKTTYIGHRTSDAMCKLFIMYYFNQHDIDPYMGVHGRCSN